MKRMARGVLTPIKRTKDGRTFYCLQYGRNGRHVSRYVPADEAEAYREATENYRMFMDAVNASVKVCKCANTSAVSTSFQLQPPPAETGAGLLTDDRLHTCIFAH